jgi:hypothetical protein
MSHRKVAKRGLRDPRSRVSSRASRDTRAPADELDAAEEREQARFMKPALSSNVESPIMIGAAAAVQVLTDAHSLAQALQTHSVRAGPDARSQPKCSAGRTCFGPGVRPVSNPSCTLPVSRNVGLAAARLTVPVGPSGLPGPCLSDSEPDSEQACHWRWQWAAFHARLGHKKSSTYLGATVQLLACAFKLHLLVITCSTGLPASWIQSSRQLRAGVADPDRQLTS